MPNSAAKQIAVGDRLTIVERIGVTSGDGQSLRGTNVQLYPDGALFFVRNSNRLYKLKKAMASDVIEDTSGNDNVINGIGSSAANGRFVAVYQQATAFLVPNESGSRIAVAGFDLSAGGRFLVSYSVPGGTQGFLHVELTSDTVGTAISSSSTDSSLVTFLFLENSQSE